MPKPKITGRQAGGGEAARVNPNPVTPGDAKTVWEFLEEPVSRSVADWFTARGRPVSSQTVLQWKRAGWLDASAVEVAQAAGAVRANTEMAAATEPNAKARTVQQMSAPPDHVGNAELAETALRASLVCVTSVFESIRSIATAGPSGRVAGDADERTHPLLQDADSIGETMLAANTALNAAVEGLKQLVMLRAEQAAVVLGPMDPGPSRH
jgi:hypothetical protein